MKKILKTGLLFFTLVVSYSAFAYNTSSVAEQCKKPKFQQFSLPIYRAPERIEVPPESEFSFILSKKIAPGTITLNIKNKPLKYKLENRNSFYRIISKIPAEYTGKFVRINAFVTAKLECKSKDGWLVKVEGAKAQIKTKVDINAEKKTQLKDNCKE